MKNGKLVFIVGNYYYWYEYDRKKSFSHNNIIDDNYHMITLTSDINQTTYGVITTKLYIDGEYTDQITENFVHLSSQAYGVGIKFIFGGEIITRDNVVNAAAIGMTLDNLRIYNSRLLNPTEIKQIYKAEGGK